jgi:hypothetical protein
VSKWWTEGGVPFQGSSGIVSEVILLYRENEKVAGAHFSLVRRKDIIKAAE